VRSHRISLIRVRCPSPFDLSHSRTSASIRTVVSFLIGRKNSSRRMALAQRSGGSGQVSGSASGLPSRFLYNSRVSGLGRGRERGLLDARGVGERAVKKVFRPGVRSGTRAILMSRFIRMPSRARASNVHVIAKDDLVRIFTIAIEAFDDQGVAARWLERPNLQTGNRPPIELIGTPEGFDIVETVLRQIQYGVLG